MDHTWLALRCHNYFSCNEGPLTASFKSRSRPHAGKGSKVSLVCDVNVTVSLGSYFGESTLIRSVFEGRG